MWRSEARRTAGQITFVIGNSTLKLDIDISEQTKDTCSDPSTQQKFDLFNKAVSRMTGSI
ncbi:hypothetical protein [Klebsiella pneumoniae IS43]|uniref:Uncharacterized protein n=1 Tax=Klebsiella pneumoniae IS43 TaxID=1432552 RepID=W1DS62_KLEPN|nr:hypothetical protein [Klebsiella pneumoniae IS43]